jgi:SAM-dependent methyltransferase
MVEKFFNNKFQKTDIEHLYMSKRISKNDFSQAYDLVGGTSINERKSYRFSSTHFQNIQYERYFKRIFLGNNTFNTGLDIGCGDGRGLDLLHKYGVKNRVGIDTNIDGLVRYAKHMPEGTYLINANPIKLSFVENIFDVVIAIEAMHYLGHSLFDEMVTKLSGAIKKDGLCIFCDHNYEAGILYSAMRGGMKDILELTKSKHSLEEIKKGNLLKVPNISLKDSDNVFFKNGFNLKYRFGISALPVLLIHLFHNTSGLSEKNKNDLCDALEMIVEEDTSLNRIYISVYQKNVN